MMIFLVLDIFGIGDTIGICQEIECSTVGGIFLKLFGPPAFRNTVSLLRAILNLPPIDLVSSAASIRVSVTSGKYPYWSRMIHAQLS